MGLNAGLFEFVKGPWLDAAAIDCDPTAADLDPCAAARLLAAIKSVIAESSSRRSTSSISGCRSRGIRRPIFASLRSRAPPDLDTSHFDRVKA